MNALIPTDVAGDDFHPFFGETAVMTRVGTMVSANNNQNENPEQNSFENSEHPGNLPDRPGNVKPNVLGILGVLKPVDLELPAGGFWEADFSRSGFRTGSAPRIPWFFYGSYPRKNSGPSHSASSWIPGEPRKLFSSRQGSPLVGGRVVQLVHLQHLPEYRGRNSMSQAADPNAEATHLPSYGTILSLSLMIVAAKSRRP